MFRGIKILSILFSSILLLMGASFTHHLSASSASEDAIRQLPEGLGNPAVHKLSANVWAITGLCHTAGDRGYSVNAGIIATEKSIVFIDSGMTIDSAEFIWRTAQEKMPKYDKLYLIITHHHSDHVFGMRVFKEKGAQIIGHRGVEEELRGDNGKYGSFIAERMGWNSKRAYEILGKVVISVPDKAIERDETLDIDGEKIQLLVTPGHVPDEICVYHLKSQTLFAGDALYEGMDLTIHFGGPEQWRQWIVQLERLKKLSLRAIVPGHGHLCTMNEIDRNIDYLSRMLRSNDK
jgi:glyoxylase-like metal-dependent hydrolase (beta-lactamase superfamily II)